MAGGSGGGGSSQQTVTSSQQIPQFEQDFAQSNQNLAASLGSQPYPAYQAPLIQDFAPQQLQGMQQAGQAATAYQPDLQNAEFYAGSGINQGAGYMQGGYNQGVGTINNALQNTPANPNVISQYMSPYVQQALAPQITALQNQLGQQQNQIAAQATAGNAFGDARQGVEQAAQNFYGNQALSGLVGQGYNTAYGNALQTALGEQQLGTQAGQAIGNLGGQIGSALGGLELQGAGQFANLGAQQQGLGIAGANALFGAGQQQQTLGQQELNTAYQQFQNQSLWPYQQLSVRESALSNSPYNITNQTTLPNANMTAQNLGMFASLAGLLGGGAMPSNGRQWIAISHQSMIVAAA